MGEIHDMIKSAFTPVLGQLGKGLTVLDLPCVSFDVDANPNSELKRQKHKVLRVSYECRVED